MNRRKPREIDDDCVPVIVPRNLKRLAPVTPERRANIETYLRDLLVLAGTEDIEAPVDPEPAGFVGAVTRAACTLCAGWCCQNGGDMAFLNAGTMLRVRRARPGASADDIVRLYLDRVPAFGYENACVFQGEAGCTLDRAMRSEICNTYLCDGLQRFVSGTDHSVPVRIFAGEGDDIRAKVVTPPRRSGAKRE